MIAVGIQSGGKGAESCGLTGKNWRSGLAIFAFKLIPRRMPFSVLSSSSSNSSDKGVMSMSPLQHG